jgi:prepilin-type N-terminal cleavage/methylation domain-containing protein
MVLRSARQHSCRRERAAGFSLIEVLISLGILSIMLIGVLPLFTKSMTNNAEGNQITEVTNRSRLHVESLLSLPFDAPALTIPAGSVIPVSGEPGLETRELFSPSEERWLLPADFPAGETPLYTRITRVRQFNVTAISDTDLELEDDEALPGGTDPTFVHLKEIEVRVNTGAPSLLNLMGGRKTVTLRVLKSS